MAEDLKVAKLEIKNNRFTSAGYDIGNFYLGEKGPYFLVQILDILVWFDGIYSREWGVRCLE